MSRQMFTMDVLDHRMTTTNLTGSYTTDSSESGTTYVISTNATTTLQLPASEVGLNYSVYVATDLSNTLTVSQNGSDVWRARLLYTDKDTVGGVSFNGASTTEGFVHYIGANDYVASSDAKGRLAGTLLEIRCFVSGEWLMTGHINGNGSVGSPFA